MDGLNDTFGRLSTNAQEWRPRLPPVASDQRQYSQQSTKHNQLKNNINNNPLYQSDLKATAVKEFVPGKAWNSHATSTAPPPTTATSSLSAQSQPFQSAQHIVHHSNNSNNNNVTANAIATNQQLMYQPNREELEAVHHHRHPGTSTVPAGPTPSPLPSFRTLHSMGLSDALWRYHRELALEANRQMEPSDPRHHAVPLPYYNAFCMDAQQKTRSSFGYPSDAFQATSREDGNLYCVRRFDNVRCVSPRIAVVVMEKWTTASAVHEHPGIVPLHRCFLAQRAVFFVHQFIPGARTLKERLEGPLLEAVVWSAVVQLTSAVRAVHAANLAVRTLHLKHVLSNTDATGSRLRLRLNCLGVVDALEFEARKNVVELQDEDIRDLGRIILSIATGTEITASTESDVVARCESFLAQNYSRELHSLAMTLIRSAPRPPSILDVSRAIAQRVLDEQDSVYVSLDKAERALAAEYESGRALRLLLKLGFVNERPEFGPNRRWAQSGDCYVLALFRDYVFHQADGAGNPVIDLGHVTSALNKLDAADEEKIVLASRDGKSLMVVSYADIARCLDNAYNELCSGSVPPSSLRY